LRNEAVQAALKTQGTDPLGSTPKEFADYIRADIEKWTAAFAAANSTK
jgi:tripartite-type tricarboxylate transporter receptor subunit TctC